jgi:hypothetical protein
VAETLYYVDPDVSGGAGDGSSWANAYSSLNAAEQARDANITAGNAVVFICGHNGASQTTADTAAVSIVGWTTDSDSYVGIRTETADRHSGVWSETKYRLVVTNAVALLCQEDYIRIEGVQLKTVSPAAADRHVLYLDSVGAANRTDVSDCLIVGHGNATYAQRGIMIDDAQYVAHVWNTIVYNIPAGNAAVDIGSATTVNVYSCTVQGGTYGIRGAGGTTTVKNSYAGGSSTEDFYQVGTGILAKTNCASEDASADDTNASLETATNCLINVALDTDTFVNVTAGSEDFRLALDGLSPLVGAGTDTSGETAPLNFTDDIVGTSRGAAWDISAFEYVSAAGGVPKQMDHINQLTWA